MEDAGFAQEIGEVRKAEKEKEKIIAQAQGEAQQIIAKAQTHGRKAVEKASEDAKAMESKHSEAERKQIAEDEARILTKAVKESQDIREKKISSEFARKEARKILDSVI